MLHDVQGEDQLRFHSRMNHLYAQYTDTDNGTSIQWFLMATSAMLRKQNCPLGADWVLTWKMHSLQKTYGLSM
jgi:hypothetical protein